MSLSSLARRPQGTVPFGVALSPGVPADGDTRDTFDALTRYIPTETITIFVAAAGALTSLHDIWPSVTIWVPYTICALLTPLIFWAVAYGRHRQLNDGTPFQFAIWPPIAATIAFLVWALSVPLVLTNPSAQTLAAVGAVLVSALLSLLEPIFAPLPPR